MSQFLDMFDILKEYNVAKGDPLGADYDEMAIDLVDGKTAFWFNGNWAWPNLEEAGAETGDEYGFLPYFMNDDPDDFANHKIQASPSKQVMLDGQVADVYKRQVFRSKLTPDLQYFLFIHSLHFLSVLCCSAPCGCESRAVSYTHLRSGGYRCRRE